MRFKIIGSGGCVALPKPLCSCSICEEARIKGAPFSRYGCSIFLEDISLLVDTPEDIVHAINHSNIKNIDNVLFSHVDPDHTLGMRVFEQLRLNWLEVSEGKECNKPINVYAMESVMFDMNSIKFKFGTYLDYYENTRNLIKRETIDKSIFIDRIKISCIKVNHATIFVFEENNKKVIYAPCDVKPLPNDDIFNNADVLIIGSTIVGNVLKGGFVLKGDNPLRNDFFTMDEIEYIKRKYNISKVIITHLEEDWGKSYNDYLKLECQYNGIQFAYDGMEIDVK
ncbi:metallo-hydrolase/oxidoreductase [[Clostridium] sordellii]|uniref:MBL fold metallo-hydrolase n=1 Tax=Paraclostridium sordellii TaxID=1505 RepID=UPI000543828E|nr:MBL fold metallo-hydrolase [Paeniclostridium sordellii]CEK30571.1 metallo-hydrolase/oxidoreductase [[Clostridium] sordellii] [Paeniclostridium sordellii]